ncbi:hypothetical protein OIDMADRAFT_49692 [Oidiodendron maius Zn]|uniref:LPXTG-domain-containing protein n=1 Tax=Oidiodendron maius (strain Zn) TaxID=913774 RepID=A0A0C3HD78_OIDMZ|nr:hypothetical protein OIDMADRAFT_49692 [Oidiodendron maius Zn]
MLSISFVLCLALCTWPTTQALQVTPNSACAQICTDDAAQNASNPNVSNTSGSDIVCKDSDYSRSAEGQRFEGCINCLQNSTFVESGESDQAWWLYNLRFAFNTCLFDTANATDPVSTSCSTDEACGSLAAPLEDGMQNPSSIQEFSYCSAYDNSFLGSYLSKCTECLRESNDQVYLANFLVALQAGCAQRPPAGLLVGVNSTVFTKNAITITSPMTSPPQPATPHKPLSKGAIIAISVVCGVAGLMIIALAFIWTRRRINARRLKNLQSPLDARFGAPNISAPYSNAYASPESPPLVKQAIAMSGSPQMVNASRQASLRPGEGRDEQSPTYSLPLSSASIPTHHAYLPPQYTPRSRSSPSPKYGSSPPSSQFLPSAPYPAHSLSPTNTPSTSGPRTPPSALSPPPAMSPPPIPSPPSVSSPQALLSLASASSPSAAPQPSPAASTPSSSSTFSLGRILHRSSNSSAEPFLPRFSLSQRSFGRGHTGTRRDPRSAFQISNPVIEGGTGLGLHAPPTSNNQANNRRRSTESIDSDALW